MAPSNRDRLNRQRRAVAGLRSAAPGRALEGLMGGRIADRRDPFLWTRENRPVSDKMRSLTQGVERGKYRVFSPDEQLKRRNIYGNMGAYIGGLSDAFEQGARMETTISPTPTRRTTDISSARALEGLTSRGGQMMGVAGVAGRPGNIDITYDVGEQTYAAGSGSLTEGLNEILSFIREDPELAAKVMGTGTVAWASRLLSPGNLRTSEYLYEGLMRAPVVDKGIVKSMEGEFRREPDVADVAELGIGIATGGLKTPAAGLRAVSAGARASGRGARAASRGAQEFGRQASRMGITPQSGLDIPDIVRAARGQKIDPNQLVTLPESEVRPQIRGVNYYTNNLQPLTRDESVELSELLAKGVRTEGSLRTGKGGKTWFDVNDADSLRLSELLARSSDEIITVDNPEALRQVITGVKGKFGNPTSMVGGSTIRPRGTVIQGGIEGGDTPVWQDIGALSQIEAEDTLLSEILNMSGMGQPGRPMRTPLKSTGRNVEKNRPGPLDVVLEDFEPGTYIVKRDPTPEEVLAQLRRTDAQAAGRAKRYGKTFKPTDYTIEDAQALISQWRENNPDAPWAVMRQTERTKNGETITDYDWIAGGTIEHVDPVKTTRKQRVGQKGNVIIVPSSLNSARGDKPLFTSGKTIGWLKSIREAKKEVKDKSGRVIVRKGEDRFVEEADQIAAMYGAVWDPKINDYVFI